MRIIIDPDDEYEPDPDYSVDFDWEYGDIDNENWGDEPSDEFLK